MKDHRQIEAGHGGGKQGLLHFPIVLFDRSNVLPEFLLHALPLDRSLQIPKRLVNRRRSRIARRIAQSPDPVLVPVTLILERSENSENDVLQVPKGLVVYEALPIGLLDKTSRALQRQVYRPDDDVAADPSRRQVHPAEVQPEPVVAPFAVVVHADAVAIDSHAAGLVKEFIHAATVRDDLAKVPVAVVYVEDSPHGADSGEQRLLGR